MKGLVKFLARCGLHTEVKSNISYKEYEVIWTWSLSLEYFDKGAIKIHLLLTGWDFRTELIYSIPLAKY